jgi:hypothetical protein
MKLQVERKHIIIATSIIAISGITFWAARFSGIFNGQQPTTTAVDTSAMSSSEPLPTPPPIVSIENIVKEQEEKSEFKSKGCCSDKEKRIKENCCCDLILQEYQTLFMQRKDLAVLKRLSNMKKHDPIFSTCYKKMRKTFEKMETDVVTKENEALGKANPKAEVALDY